ncbi:MAG TPA: hypothetical protein VGD78_07055 [Chthoniobacterales bacterium]
MPGPGPAGAGPSWWVWLGLAVGYALLLFANPVSPFLGNGWRALQRHPRILIWFAALTAIYALFQNCLAIEVGELSLVPDGSPTLSSFRPSSWSAAAARAWLPALDSVGGTFHQAVVTYPASSVAALLFLLDCHGTRRLICDGARLRLGRAWWAVGAALMICAVAALFKPLFAAFIYLLNGFVGGVELLQIGAVLDALSFQFETLFGMLVQVYLILLTYAWIRGLSVSPDRVFGLALKRSVFTARWTGVLLVAGIILVNGPLLVTYVWISLHTDFTRAVVQYVDQTARPLLDVVLILFGSVQVCLVFHNEELTRALNHHGRFVRAYGYRYGWFLLVTGCHFFLLYWLGSYLQAGFPAGSLPERLTAFGIAEVRAVLAAWFLASWVCFYRAMEQGGREVKF